MFTSRAKAILVIAAVLLLGPLVAACTGGEASSEDSVRNEPVTVDVEAGSLYITPSQTTFKVGVPYHFVVTNTAEIPHEVMLMPRMQADSGMDMEQMDAMALGMVEEDDFPPGSTASFDVTFTKPYSEGELEFACHLPGHYQGGMHIPITVVAQ